MCGAIYPLGFGPFKLFPLTILALSGLFLALIFAKTYRGAFFYGWLFGVTKFGVGASWIYVSIQQYGEVSPWSAGAIVGVFVLLISILTGFVGLAVRFSERSRPSSGVLSVGVWRCLQFALIWFTYEWLRSTVLTGFPVMDAGYALVGTAFDGLAPILGVKGVSFAMAFVAAGLCTGIGSLLAALVVVFLCYGLNTFTYVDRVDPRQVGIVQVNVPLTEKFQMARTGETFRIYEALTRSLPPQDLVLWSEAAFATRQQLMVDSLDRLRERTDHKYIASGYIEFADDGGPFNSLVVGGDEVANYRKLRLVPFGEYVPFEDIAREWLTWISVPHSNLVESDTSNRDVSVPGLNLAAAICYEASFESDVHKAVRQARADAIVVVSEDAWFGNSLAPHQNFEMARMRAKEHGRYVIRAANSGISGIVAPDGSVIAQAEQFTRTAISAEIHTMQGNTPYTWLGPVVSYFFLGMALFVITVMRVIGSRQAARKFPY